MSRFKLLPRKVAMLGSRVQAAAAVARSGKVVDAFYVSPEWRALKREIIRERGWRCEAPGCATPRSAMRRLYGDHRIELKDGGAPLDRANVMLLCATCHGLKTHAERRQRDQRG